MNESRLLKLNVLERLMVLFVAVCFVIISYGSVRELFDFRIAGDASYKTLCILMAVTGIIFLHFLYVVNGFILKAGNRLQPLITVILFVCGILVTALMLHFIRPFPMTDSLDDIDTGWYLIDGVIASDNKHILTLNAYGNNYLLIIIFKYVISFLLGHGVTDILLVLTVINFGLLFLGLLIMFAITAEEKGIRMANSLLAFAVLNPLLYALGYWVYSASISVFMIMAMIWLLIHVRNTKHAFLKCIYGILIGLFTVTGYYIRPVVVFPLIAFVVIWICRKICGLFGRKGEESSEGHESFRGNIIAIILMLLVSVSLFIGIKLKINSYFHDQIPNNQPIASWLYMGSHGDGNLNTQYEDTGYDIDLKANPTGEELLKATIYSYRKNGISGTAKLWIRKMIITFSNGHQGVLGRMTKGASYSLLLELVTGTFAQIYAQIYRIVMCLGILLSALFIFIKGKRTDGDMLAFVTLIGAIVFYFFWEAKGDYSLPFILLMSMISIDGFSMVWNKALDIRVPKGISLAFICLGLMVTCFGAYKLNEVFSQKTTVTDNILDGSTYTRSSILEIGDDEELSQSFTIKGGFNTIQIEAIQGDQKVSSYLVSLTDAEGKILYEKKIKLDKLKGLKGRTYHGKHVSYGYFTVKTGNQPKGEYQIRIKKMDPKLSDGAFMFSNTYYLKAYEGELLLGDSEISETLGMRIQRRLEDTSFYPLKLRLVIMGAFALMCLIAFGGCALLNKRTNR